MGKGSFVTGLLLELCPLSYLSGDSCRFQSYPFGKRNMLKAVNQHLSVTSLSRVYFILSFQGSVVYLSRFFFFSLFFFLFKFEDLVCS